MPTISAVGKRRPTSTTTIEPSYSTTVMFLPISPRPPSGRTRRVPLMRSNRAPHPVALEHRADLRLLVLARLDERQTHPADLVPEHVQSRLERDRARSQVHQ